jgi:hypothetical protein
MGTKNNPANRGKANEARIYNGKPVKPVKYMGSHFGHGTYMTAQYEDGNMVMDEADKPVMWDAM